MILIYFFYIVLIMGVCTRKGWDKVTHIAPKILFCHVIKIIMAMMNYFTQKGISHPLVHVSESKGVIAPTAPMQQAP